MGELDQLSQLDQLIADAFARLLPRLLADPQELRRRLARRQRPSLSRPPRAWCLAIRASDHRLSTSSTPSLPPSSILHLPSSTSHSITLTSNLLLSLCRPIRIPSPGLDWTDVARLLGSHPESLRHAMRRGQFSIRYIPHLSGKRGKPVPILYTNKLLDPAHVGLHMPDPLWGNLWEYRNPILPPDLAHTLQRVPVFRPLKSSNPLHTPRPSTKLPPPPPDYVGYKWKGNQYLGHDWRNPLAAAHYQRFERQRATARKHAREKARRRRRPLDRASTFVFCGWRWICPACNRPVRVLYYPLPLINFLSTSPAIFSPFTDPHLATLPPCHPFSESPSSLRRSVAPSLSTGNSQLATYNSLLRLLDLYPFPDPIPTFACVRCHKIRYFSRIDHASWNDMISYLTTGLLFGREVPKPSSFSPQRKRAYRPCLMRPPSARRQQVLDLLLQGHTYDQIAADLGVGYPTVHQHVKTLYKQHRVHSRRALAAKLDIQLPPAHRTHTPARRQQVRRLHALGQSCKQIAKTLGVSYHIVHRDLKAIRQTKNSAPLPAAK